MVSQASAVSAEAQRAKAKVDRELAEKTRALKEFDGACDKLKDQVYMLKQLKEFNENDRVEAERNLQRLEKARASVLRLRNERDEWKAKAAALERRLEEAERTAKPPVIRDEFDTSESETDQRDSGQLPTGGLRNTVTDRLSRRGTPGGFSIATGVTRTSTHMQSRVSNNRYPDIEKFHGKEDEDVHRWIESAKNKFEQSHELFPEESDKIKYLLHYVKNDAYAIIKDRAMRDAEDPYADSEELFQELSGAFGWEDRETDALNDITKGKYAQKHDESIALWSARFITACRRAKMSDGTVKFFALQNIHSKFKNAAINAAANETWTELVTRMKTVERNKTSLNTTIPETQKKTTDGKPKAGGNKKKDDNAPRRNAEEFQKIKKAHVCAKCFQKNHVWTEQNAPCKDKKPLPMSKFDESIALADVTENGATAAELDAAPAVQGNA